MSSAAAAISMFGAYHAGGIEAKKSIEVGSSCNLITVFMWRVTPPSSRPNWVDVPIFVAKSFLESCGVACHFLQSCGLPEPDAAICARQIYVQPLRSSEMMK